MKIRAIIAIVALQTWPVGVPAAIFTVTSTNDAGAGSLREAIKRANTNAGLDTIAFDLPGAGVRTIVLESGLPEITDAVVIDGYTQPGAAPNTLSNGFNGTLLVQIDGSGLFIEDSGLLLSGGHSTVRGLILVGLPTAGISLWNGGTNVVEGNLIGLDVASNTRGNRSTGVSIWNSSGNRIGGETPAARNVISGNLNYGILIDGHLSANNLVLGNFIGTGLTGSEARPNGTHGIRVQYAGGTLIGGTSPGARNVISGNDQNGVFLAYFSGQNRVLGNFIGTDAGGTQPLGNGMHGVHIETSTGNVVGGTNAPEANLIAFNLADGVAVTGNSSTNNTLRGNRIFDNGGLGIDLGNNGVTANDPLDSDIGPNGYQNYPVLTNAVKSNATMRVAGTLRSQPNRLYRLDFYASPVADDSGHGEGQTYLGSANVQLGEVSYQTSFVVTLPAPALGSQITATATDPEGNTSEFSAAVPLLNFDSADLAIWQDGPVGPVSLRSGLQYTLTVTNQGPAHAAGVAVSNILSTGFGVTNAVASQGTWTFTNGLLRWNVGSLNAGSAATFQVQVAAALPGRFEDTATVYCPQHDPDPDNNVTDGSTTVYRAIADLIILQKLTPTNLQAGGTVTCLVTLTNAGPDPVSDVLVFSSPNYPLAPVSALASQGTVELRSGQFLWRPGTIPAGAAVTLEVRAFAWDVGEGYVYSSFELDGYDPISEDDWAQSQVTINPGPGIFQFSSRFMAGEGAGHATVTVQRLGGAVGAAQVNFFTLPDSATAGTDYTPTNGTLFFTNGQTEAAFRVPILEDVASECNESARLVLANPTGGALLFGHTNVALWIADNDLPAPVGTVEAVSLSTNRPPATGNGYSYNAAVSADGRFVAFTSDANDLVAGDANGSADVFLRDLTAQTTTLISVNAAGSGSGNHYSYAPALSADGRYVLFGSYASNLVTNDFNETGDLFVRDHIAGVTTLVSCNAAGSASGNGESWEGQISPDGRFVVFSSYASDLTGTLDENGTGDVFLRDLAHGATWLISVNAAGTAAGNGYSSAPSVSADGRYVVFVSNASDLVTNDFNGRADVFVRDTLRGVTTLVSVNAAGTASANGDSSNPVISPDGRVVAFESAATDLVTNAVTTEQDVYVRDLVAGVTRLVSADPSGAHGGNGASFGPSLSADGRFVAFESNASNLVTNDLNGDISDVFVRDLAAGSTLLISRNCAGTGGASDGSRNPRISADGRHVVFLSGAPDLVPGEFRHGDVFLCDLQTRGITPLSRNVQNTGGGDTGSWSPALSADGSTVAFESEASNLVTHDANGMSDVFVWRRAASVPAPALSIRRSNRSVIVSWPLTAAGWLLEWTNVLPRVSAPWPVIPPPYQTNGPNLQFIEPAPTGTKFYRLHKP